MNKYANKVIEWYGVEKKTTLYNMIQLLIQTKDDSDELDAKIIEHETLFFALAEMRNERVRRNLISESDFLKEYSEDRRHALEKLFQEKIFDHILKLLTKRMDQGKITLSELYNRHCKNPGYRLGSFLL